MISLAIAMAALHPILGKARETELALEAAPLHLRQDVGVWLLADNGYRRERESRNGYECLVIRDPNDVIAPVCYDATGAKSLLLKDLMRGRLLREGKSEDDIRAATEKAFASGELKAPEGPGIAYMLSPHFASHNPQSGKPSCVFPPHMMFYVPYRTNADFGIPRTDFGSTTRPWILNEGKADAYFIVGDHSQTHLC